MLQKFLFVGIGGSGGKTLRFLHELLQARLDSTKWTEGMPEAWQFVHIDVPVTPDGTSPDLPPQLPAGHYHGLAPAQLTFSDIDALVQQKGRKVVEHTAPWRPDPNRVAVPPAFGAGQYRAVGRTILAAAMPNVLYAIRGAVNRLQAVAVDQQLDRLSIALTGDGGVSAFAPQVIVVNSIAGGSGAGTFLDVCDVIRAVLPASRDQVAAVLYTPEVFSAIPAASLAGVNANALASIAELVNAYWNSDQPTPAELALPAAAGVPAPPSTQRGPSMSLLVGRSNGSVTFTSDIDVFRATARALTSWTSDQSVQDGVNAAVIGNFASSATHSIDRLGLAPGRPAPFSALGYASIGLGRGRFRTYSRERLARHAVEILLRNHVHNREDHETADAARDRLAKDHLFRFLDQAGLRELGQDQNQVIDGIRGDGEDARDARLRARDAELVSRATKGLDALDRQKAGTKMLTATENLWHDAVSAEKSADDQRAVAWITSIQRQVLEATATLVGRTGLAVATRVIDFAIDEIDNAVVPELRGEASRYQHIVTTTDKRIRSVFAGLDSVFPVAHPAFAKAAEEARVSFVAASEQHLRDLAATLLGELAKGLLVPLRGALAWALDDLDQQERGEGDGNVIALWSVGAVPKKLLPTENERLLELPDGYPVQFVDHMRRTTGISAETTAIRSAVGEIIAGRLRENAAQSLIRPTSDWAPPVHELSTLAVPSKASFAIELGADSLLGVADGWLDRPQTAFADHLRGSLAAFLDDDGISPAERQTRLDRFEAELRQAVKVARPLVEIDLAAYSHFHGPVSSADDLHLLIMSKFPFPAGHPARDRVRKVFPQKADQELAAMFDDAPAQRVELTTFLGAAAQPVVFSSLTQPIASDWSSSRAVADAGGFWIWRRTRPLAQAIPASPDMRGRMIRGWFVARLLGHIDASRPLDTAVTLRDPDGGSAFPFPLLGERIQAMDDIMPAVLESLSVALVDDPRQSLRPYHRLAELGASHGSAVGSRLPDELDRWLASGDIPPWSAFPDPDLAGKPSEDRAERAGTLVATLTRFADHYRALSAPTQGGPRPRALELRTDIDEQLTALRDAIEAASQSVDFTVGVG